ncbi:MAG TPA: hypothetical protein PLJ47_06310 [Candidatus Hydrogenedentes bacterium]|nr:hypothetical protein [Candidatus Hydrogenedentota bacterium]HRK34190.1 hypothetical protein [Candidatus Hydrogenedentota bacterium]
MIPVTVRGDFPLVYEIEQWVNSVQDRFGLSVSSLPTDLTEVFVTNETHHGLFRVLDERRVVVSTWQSDGLSHYAGLSMAELMGLSTLLGLMQVRALQLNTFLRAEDFVHPSNAECLFATLPLKQSYAGTLESLNVCSGCRDFYRCLELEPEVDVLLRLIQHMENGKTAQGRPC